MADFKLQQTGEEVQELLNKVTENTQAIEELSNDTYKKNEVDVLLDGKTNSMISIVHADLVALRDNGQLIPGQFYRITDFVTTVDTTTNPEARSAGHPFDVIVRADSTTVLNENARAVNHHKYISAIIVEGNDEYYTYQRYSEGDSDDGYAWVYNPSGDNQQTINEAIENGIDWYFVFPGDLIYTDTLMPSIGDVLDMGGIDVEVEDFSDSININHFANSKLESWVLKYCLDNNTDRFNWADAENGKGVIYRLIDEYNNDCPYDFKNVQFKYGLNVDGGIVTDGSEDYTDYLYTFSHRKRNGHIIDASIFGNDGTLLNDESSISGVYNNIIGPRYTRSSLLLTQTLNNNVFFSYIEYDGAFYGYHDNTLGLNCYNNIFSNGGNGSYSNKLSALCDNNIFVGGCSYNILREYCSNNQFNTCSYIVLSYGCRSNIFGSYCNYITLNEQNYNNTFGDECRLIKLHGGCYSNKIGHLCESIILGDNNNNNTLGDCCKKVTFNGNVTNTTVVGGTSNSYIQNLTVIGTVIGKTIDISRNEEYETFAGMNRDGDFVIWTPADNA